MAATNPMPALMPKMLVGLGNPGPSYVDTRHNAGFWWADRVAQRLNANYAAEGRFWAKVSKTHGTNGPLWLVQPQTFMNASGKSVAALARFYQISPAEIVVAHDELDLAPGEIRLKQGGSGGGNGVKDIVAQLGSADFWRLRLGIGHPRAQNLNQAVADYVLHPPKPHERTAIDQALDRALDALDLILAGDMKTAIQRLHTPP